MRAETGTGRDLVRATAERLRVDDVMRPATSTVEGTAHLAAAAYLMKHRGDTALMVTTDDADALTQGIGTIVGKDTGAGSTESNRELFVQGRRDGACEVGRYMFDQPL